MNSDETSAEFLKAVKALQSRVESAVLRHARIDLRMLEDVDGVIRNHRREWRMRGVGIPELVVVPLMRRSAVEMVRKDTTPEGFRQIFLIWLGKYPGLTDVEMKDGLAYSFPQFRKLKPPDVAVGRVTDAPVAANA